VFCSCVIGTAGKEVYDYLGLNPKNALDDAFAGISFLPSKIMNLDYVSLNFSRQQK